MRIAVIGAGSSGLVTLKYLAEKFPDSEITCFEKTDSLRGCWGDQRPDFVSTSTKYSTQFSCFRKWGPETSPQRDYSEFFRGGEFGDYLEAFADHFSLRGFIRFRTQVRQVTHDGHAWQLVVAHPGQEETLTFDAVFLCTGLVNQKPPPIATPIPTTETPEGIRNKTVVVIGGGESAADVANTLARHEYGNRVYLSLRSGIRVSPRYHPIRGVPSDFLRNRLLLSFNKQARNWFGEHFVTFRIRFDQLLAQWFPHQGIKRTASEQARARRRAWDLKLKARAKGGLFNVFHNKSDDFLDAVAEERLQIIGPVVDENWQDFWDFDRTKPLRLTPDALVWSTGYQSRLAELSDGQLALKDFYLGCVHTRLPNLFLIGFARPIIGNIPTISEMQARYAAAILHNEVKLPPDVEAKQQVDWQALCTEYSAIDTNNVYPVEHIPYTDRLARELGLLPRLASLRSLTCWIKLQLVPASTTHYMDEYFDRKAVRKERVYTPVLLILLMLLLSPLNLLFILRRWVMRQTQPRPENHKE